MSTQSDASPYLISQRQFPSDELKMLARQSDQAYIDVAQKVNARIIGTFALDQQIITGESWVLQGQPKKQQSLRRVFIFTSFASITHNIDISKVSYFTRIYGGFKDSNTFYPIPYVNPTASNQVGVSITSTQIVFSVGGTAPTPTSGVIVVEWIPVL